jgi:hypothetical protein
MTVPDPQAFVRYITADGRLTPEGMQLFLAWVAIMRDHETRLAALE